MPEVPRSAFELPMVMMPRVKDASAGGTYVLWQPAPGAEPRMPGMMPPGCAGAVVTSAADSAAGMFRPMNSQAYAGPNAQPQRQQAACNMAPAAPASQQARCDLAFTAPAQQQARFGPAFAPKHAARLAPDPHTACCDRVSGPTLAPRRAALLASEPQQAYCDEVRGETALLMTPAPKQSRTPLPMTMELPDMGGEAAEPMRASQSTLQRRLRRQRAAQAAREEADCASAEAWPAAAQEAELVDRTEVSRLPALQQSLEAGEAEQRAAAIRELRGSVLTRSFHSMGCRVVQSALDLCSIDEAAELAAELRGHVREACENRHANFVVAKVLEVLPAEHAPFVAQELSAFAAAGVRHKFGCRIFCRLIEHASTHPDAAALIVDAVARQAEDLARHEFAHFVVAHVLEHGLPQHAAIATESLLQADLGELARHRHGRYGVEALFRHAALEDQAVAVERLGDVVQLAGHEFGHTAVVAALQSPVGARLVDALAACAPELQATKFGQRVLQEAGRVPRTARP